MTEEKAPPFDCFVPHKYANVSDLFINENYRKQGAGSRLLDSAKQWARSRGLEYLELNVLSENINGIQFYEHENFKAVSQIMRCTL